MTKSRQPTVATRVLSITAGLATASALAWFAHTQGHDDLAAGVLTGTSASIIVATVLGWIGQRGGLAGRMASGGDERDRAIVTSAMATTAPVMALVAAVCTVGATAGLSGIAVGGITIWSGILTFAIAAVVSSRRG